MKNSPQISKKFFFLLFALSGFTSLLLQLLWTRLLSLGVGSTSSALSIALAIFFMGLASGSYLISKKTETIHNPLRLYGLIEGFIGLLSIPICFALFHFSEILQIIGIESSLSVVGTAAKFLVVFLLLILPTLGMGATLPLLVKAFASDSPKNIAKLYGINTLGAFLGCLSASFVLIPLLGIFGSAATAMILNLGICIYVMIRIPAQAPVVFTKNTAMTPTKVMSPMSKFLLFTSGVTGFSSIAAEIVWNKYLGIFFGTNIYGLGLNLGLFLLGIACGSLLLSKYFHRIKNPNLLYGALLALSALALILTSQLLNSAPKIAIYLSFYSGGLLSLFAAKALTVFLLMVVPTSLFGALFPCAISLLSVTNTSAPRATGLAYAVNTLGAIISSILVGHFLIPKIGSSSTILVGFTALSVVAIPFVWKHLSRKSSVVLAILLLAVGFSTNAIDFRNIVKAAYVQSTPSPEQLSTVMKIFHNDYEDFKLLIEGETAVITLSHDPQDGIGSTQYLRLKSNGLNESVYDSKNLEALPKYEALLGFLPHLFVRSPQNAFVVGYGGGCTTDYLTRTPLKEVHVVELEEGVLEAAQYVYQDKNPIFERRNLRLEVEDARFVLSNSKDKSYDMIMSQPSHSWLSGVANLFTLDFFEIVKAKLSDKGVFSQWLNLYNIDERVLKSILKTFFTVFPHGAVFTDYGESQMIMVGSNQPVVLNTQKLSLMSKNPIFKRQMQYVPFNSPEDILSIFSIGRTQAMELSQDAPLNTDNNVYAETMQSRIFYRRNSDETDGQNFLRIHYTANFSDLLNGESERAPEFQEALLENLLNSEKYDKFQAALIRYEATPNKSLEQQINTVRFLVKAERFASAAKLATSLLRTSAAVDVLNMRLKIMSSLQDFSLLSVLLQGQRVSRNDKETQCYLAHAELIVGKKTRYNISLCGALSSKLKGYQKMMSGDVSAAIKKFEEYLQVATNDLESITILKELYSKSGYESKVVEDTGKYAQAEIERLKSLAEYYRSLGLNDDAEVLERKAAKY